jgi:hypothetical protein
MAFSIGALAFEGDLPASIFHLQLIENEHCRLACQVGGHRLHTNAGHVTLHDVAYNAERNIATGNPYKDFIGDLQKLGVQIELCGATANAHNSGNADLFPGIKVN